jgi:hypothetical protein
MFPVRYDHLHIKDNAILATSRGGLWGCEIFRIPTCLDSRLTDDGEDVSLTPRPRFTPWINFISVSGTHFC